MSHIGRILVKKMVEKRIDGQRSLITFFSQIADICVAFNQKRKSDNRYEQLYFREVGDNHPWHQTQGSGWANALFRCVYDSVSSGKNIIEISPFDDTITRDTQTDVVKLNEGLTIQLDVPPQDDQNIREILVRLEHGFLDSRIVAKIVEDYNSFFTVRKQLSSDKNSVFHLSKKEIKDYLKKYYIVLNDVVQFYDDFDSVQDRESLIGELLRLDAKWDDQQRNYQFSLWAPIVLNKLQKVTEAVEVFFERLTVQGVAENDWLQKIYTHILMIKAQHSFRWYISGQDQRLFHATIPPYGDNPNSLNLQVVARNLEQYNSYEGIKELRLGEKILYEYRLMHDKVDSEFAVAIMGDLNAEPLWELYDYVNSKIEHNEKKLVLKFHAYTKRKLDLKEYPHIDYQGDPAGVLFSRENLSRVISDNHLVFILDCIELYKPLMPRKKDLSFIRQKYAYCNYDEYNYDARKADICDRNMLEELYEVMTGEQSFHQFGWIAKQANASLLEFCKERQHEKKDKSAVYIYVSDMDAFQNIYNDEQYYIRTERYHQKEIGIIRYSSERVKKLEVGNKKNRILVFNIWQFIKNVSIEEKDLFFQKEPDLESTYKDLDQIHIGIDYCDWPNRLVIHYYCEKDAYKPVAVKFINNVLLPILNNRSKDMFNSYIRKAMYSSFFSAAKSVMDMLFIHLLKDKEELLGISVSAQENDAEWVRKNRNKDFKFSSKRFYDLILKNYDISSNLYIEQARTSHIIQKNEADKANQIYENVIKACENLSYENGYLAKNCRREIKGNYCDGNI